jgi:hypothetical protein
MVPILLFGMAALAVYIGYTMTDNATPEIPTSGRLNAAQIAQLASNAGFTEQDLATAVAVALAESGGKVDAYNPETAAGTPEGKGSYGLWQIYLKMHPEYTPAALLDPQTNANAAFKIYQQRGETFAAWSTYTNGAYLAHAAEAGNATGFELA